MKNLLRFFITHHIFFLFIIWELVCGVLILYNNSYHRVAFMNSGNIVSGTVLNKYSSMTDYFNLKEKSQALAQENIDLRNQLEYYKGIEFYQDSVTSDTVSKKQFIYHEAKVINTSTNRTFNYITINKGEKDGIAPDMGIINKDGVLGIVTNVSDHFAVAISLLNSRLNISARVKGSNYFGSLTWDGNKYDESVLNEIPFHVKLSVGDTIVTSGYSQIFPEDIMLGVISKYEIKGGSNFFNIRVKLSPNFKTLNYVTVIENKLQDEYLKLEEEIDE